MPCVCACAGDSVSLASHHARVDRGLLDVAGDAGHKCVPVFEVCVEICLRRERGRVRAGRAGKDILRRNSRAYLVHDGGGRRFDAWLLVRQRQLLQQVHVRQGILQGHVGRHRSEASLTQNRRLVKLFREEEEHVRDAAAEERGSSCETNGRARKVQPNISKRLQRET